MLFFQFISQYFVLFYTLFKLKLCFFIIYIILFSVNEIYFETRV